MSHNPVAKFLAEVVVQCNSQRLHEENHYNSTTVNIAVFIEQGNISFSE